MAAAFAVVLVSAGSPFDSRAGGALAQGGKDPASTGLGRLCLLSSVFSLLTTDYCPQLLNKSSNALRDVVCRAEPVSRSTVARALKSGQGVKASFGVTRAVIGCMHS